MEKRYPYKYVVILFSFTLSCGFLLSSCRVSADIVDDVSIVVPASCNLTGTNIEHNATINNGTHNSNVGLSTMKVYCNDNEGFSIYAIGYTNDEDGDNILTDGTHNIETGIQTSGNNSQWAMKIATIADPTPTYPLMLDSDADGSFGNYHVVPSVFTKVAHRASSTDVGQSALGSTFTSTYQVYISPTQAAGTYVGKVKYLLVHPASKVPPVGEGKFITIDYWGNGKQFSNNDTKNTVTYEIICDQQGENCHTKTVWGQYREPIGFTKWVGKINGGENVEFSSETEMLAAMEYSISEGSIVIPDGNNTIAFVAENNDVFTIISYGNDREGLLFNDGSATNVYSIMKTCGYPTESNPCSNIYDMFEVVNGTYEEPSRFKGWRASDNNGTLAGKNYEELYILMYVLIGAKGWENVLGQIIVIEAAYSPGTVSYNGNGETQGNMSSEDINGLPGNELFLRTPNFKKNGYGFIGWSENVNATVNNGSRIFGPNELIQVEDLHLQNKNTTLYAIWVPSAGNMQNWSGCGSLNNRDVTALTDARDGNTYAIAKLADGNCWMIENLRLDNTAILSSSDTNNPLLPLTNIYGSTTSNRISSSVPLENWCQTYNASCTDQSMFYSDNLTALSNSTKSITDDAYGRGGLYNYYSATAGNVTSSIAIDALTNGDICPIGWRLPTLAEFENTHSDNDYGISFPNNGIVAYDYGNVSRYLLRQSQYAYGALSYSEWKSLDGWMMNLDTSSYERNDSGMVRCILK